jgi:hypothetical protein
MKAQRPEHELLRLCVRRRLVPTDDASVGRLLERPLDWLYLFNLGDHHQVLPLLNECLLAARGGAVPPTVLKAVTWRLATVRARNRRFAEALVGLHHAATAAGLPVLSFKGPLLATMLYGDVGLRQFGDLDMLVDPGSFARAEELFACRGYQRTRDHGYEVTLVNESTGISVDLHRALSPDNFPVSMSFARLWSRREMVGLEGSFVETLSARDALMALCIGAVKDARVGQVKLGKISDLAHLFAAAGTTDWTEVESQARRLGLQRVMGFGIRLTAGVLEIPASGPPGLLASPRRWERFVREAEDMLFAAPRRRPPERHGALFHFHIRERWRDKLWPYGRYVLDLVTPSSLDRSVVTLPRRLSLLYYVVRPVRLAHKYAARLMRYLPFDRRPLA